MKCAANIQAIRSERLKDLRNSKGISTKGLADATGISVGSLNAWENDDAVSGRTSTDGIKLENLIKLADYYGVSLDYLAGRTDIKSTSPTLQGVCEYTGLSESVVSQLNAWAESMKEEFKDELNIGYHSAVLLSALNSLLESDGLVFLLSDLSDYIKKNKTPHFDVLSPLYSIEASDSEVIEKYEGYGFQLLSPQKALDYAYFKVNDTFSYIVQNELVKEDPDDGEH